MIIELQVSHIFLLGFLQVKLFMSELWPERIRVSPEENQAPTLHIYPDSHQN